MKVLCTFPHQVCGPRRVQNLEELKLDPVLENNVKQTIQEYGLLWELWVEAAETYDALRDSLRKRGYTKVPLPSTPMHHKLPDKWVNKKPDADVVVQNNQKAMLRKKPR